MKTAFNNKNDKKVVTAVAASGPPQEEETRPKRMGLIMLSLCLSLSPTALDLTAVSTALPTIVHSLNGADFIWAGASYALAIVAILPMTSGIAQLFGRKWGALSAIALFAVGSTMCGASKSMAMLIAGRTVQGLGAGGIFSFTSIILGDLVPLKERGLYEGLFGLTWSVAAVLGPLVGGILSHGNQWRWLFYLNLPLSCISATLTAMFLDLPIPPGTIREKLAKMDWIGNFIVISSACAGTIALTQGGIEAPWDAPRIIGQLVVGILGLIFFLVYEFKWAKHPMVPFHILANRTSLSGYLQAFFLSITSLAAIYFMPVYYQAVKNYDVIQSGIDMLGLASLAPAAIVGAVSVKLTQRYRPQIWVGWCLELIGLSLLTLIKVDTPAGVTVGFCIIYGVGGGLNYATQMFPIQAPLPVSSNAHALAFLSFVRVFGEAWGVTIGGAILQNQLQHKLPPQFLAESPSGAAIFYAAIPEIKDLSQPLKDEVRQGFNDSLRLIWIVLTVVCVFGILSSLMMEGLPLHKYTDQYWVLKDKESQGNIESSSEIVLNLLNQSEDMDNLKNISNDQNDMVTELINDDWHNMDIESEAKNHPKMFDDSLEAVVLLTNDRITAI